MTIVQYLSTFRVFGSDVLLLAIGVSAITSLVKKTVFKNLPNKVYVFLPFAVGVIVYAAFRALVTMSAEPFIGGLSATLEGGFACGCAATLYYLIYEQFIRNGLKTSDMPPVGELLKDLVPESERKKAAEELTANCADKTAEELYPYIAEVLRRYAGTDKSETEIELRTHLVAKFLTQTK